MDEDMFKVGKLSEEELKKLEEEAEGAERQETETIIDKLFRGEYVEREYIVIDIQLPRKEWNVRKVFLYVLETNEPLTIDINNPRLPEVAGIIKKMKFAKVRVRQLKVTALVDGKEVEDISKDVDEVLNVEEIDPLEYMKNNAVRYNIAPLRRGSKSAYYREDGIIKLVISGNTVNGMRLYNMLNRDGYTKVLLVPSSITKKGDGVVVVGCWFMIKKTETEVIAEEDVEKMVEEAEKEITHAVEEQKQVEKQEQAQAGEQKQAGQGGGKKIVLKLHD